MGKFDISEYIGLDLINTQKYSIVINGYRINKVIRFTIRRTIENFIDTFDIELGNINNQISPYVYVGDIVQFMRDGSEVLFEGIVEKKVTKSDNVEMSLTISGRDSLVDTVLTSAPFQTYKNTTDNAIIQKMMESTGRSFQLQLGAPKSVPEYTVGPGDSIASVIDGVAKQNDYFIWKKGNTIIKESIASSGYPVYNYYIGLGNYDNQYTEAKISGSNVLQYSSEEDIGSSITEILGYSQSGSKSKNNLKASGTVPVFQSNDYQRMIRTGRGHIGSSSRINRKVSMSLAGKSLAECQKELNVALKKAEPKVRITLVVKGFQDFELNDIIHLKHDGEGIDKDFVLTGIMYTMDENNREVSELTLQNLGAYPR